MSEIELVYMYSQKQFFKSLLFLRVLKCTFFPSRLRKIIFSPEVRVFVKGKQRAVRGGMEVGVKGGDKSFWSDLHFVIKHWNEGHSHCFK